MIPFTARRYASAVYML